MVDKTGDIEEAPDFNELYKILENKGVIIGSKGKEYPAKTIIDQISQIREDLEDSRREEEIGKLTSGRIGTFILKDKSLKEQILCITNEEGLRTKIIELAINEVMDQVVGE